MNSGTRLFRWSQWIMYGSLSVVVLCLSVVFGLDGMISIGWLVVGHALILLGATGVKLGYIMRLEAVRAKRRVRSV